MAFHLVGRLFMMLVGVLIEAKNPCSLIGSNLLPSRSGWRWFVIDAWEMFVPKGGPMVEMVDVAARSGWWRMAL